MNALFILGKDYHLGDLLWFTTVLRDFRCKVAPSQVIVSLPDREISRILEHNPLIDELVYRAPRDGRRAARSQFGGDVAIHDLRAVPIGIVMVRQWRRRRPWLYYRDLWLQPRGQWLATFLGLGELQESRPTLRLVEGDRAVAGNLPRPYVLLAPHVGGYSLPFAGAMWRAIKGWPAERWTALAEHLRESGYHTFTLGTAGGKPIPGTTALMGLPIRQVAGVVEGASALVTVESGLWFIAAALGVPFLVRWWLPRSVDWPGAAGFPHARILRYHDSVSDVLARLERVMSREL